MTALVIDSSVAIKWVVPEADSSAALLLRERFDLIAPDLIIAECANIFWKKARRGEMNEAEIATAARLLEESGIDVLPMRGLLQATAKLAIELGHPAYDCVYLVFAQRHGARLVTADTRLASRVAQFATLGDLCVRLDDPNLFSGSYA